MEEPQIGLLLVEELNNRVLICWTFILNMPGTSYTHTYPLSYTLNNPSCIVQEANSQTKFMLSRGKTNVQLMEKPLKGNYSIICIGY